MSAIGDWLNAAERVPPISRLLQELRHDRSSGLLPEFHYHPLGFTYASLAKGDGVAIRLHIWSDVARAQEPVWSVHNHGFSFSSLVLVGSTRNECFKFRLDPKGDVGEFTVDYNERGSVLTSLGILGYLSETEAIVVNADELYTMPADKLHRTSPCDNFVATLLRTSQVGAREILVMGSTQHPFSVAYKREEVDRGTSRALFDRLVAELEATHP